MGIHIYVSDFDIKEIVMGLKETFEERLAASTAVIEAEQAQVAAKLVELTVEITQLKEQVAAGNLSPADIDAGFAALNEKVANIFVPAPPVEEVPEAVVPI